MDYLDPELFVNLMTPQLESVAKLALRKQSTCHTIYKSDDQDDLKHQEKDRQSRVGVFSLVDLEIQENLLGFIYKNWSFVSILAEEDTVTKKKFKEKQKYYVLLDPIDGSKYYLQNDTKFCHIISLMKDTDMLVSMVYSHARNKLYTAIANVGTRAFSNSTGYQDIKLVPRQENIFLHHVDRIPETLVTELCSLDNEVVVSSQNATDILNMLDGNIAGFISKRPIIYDVWSPAMIVQEAGGWVSDWHGSSLTFSRKERVTNILVSRTEQEAKNVLPILAKYT